MNPSMIPSYRLQILNSNGQSYYPNVSSWLTQGKADGGTSPTAAQLTALSDFMDALDVNGLGPAGSRMKTMNILHLGSKQFCLLNIKDVTTFKYSEVGTVNFSVLNGCKSSSSSYFNQPFKSNQYAGIESNLTAIIYISESNTTPSAAKVPYGFQTQAGHIHSLFPFSGATNSFTYNYSGTGNTFAGLNSNTNHKGLYIQTHTGTNAVLYRNGVKGSIVRAANAPSLSINRFVLAYNPNGAANQFYDAAYVALDCLYDRFNDADAANFKTAFDNYKAAIGLP